MSHRKFEAPRHGSLGFAPRKRTRQHRGRVKAFPKDDKSKKPHLTAFMAYKAGMTHVVRDLDKVGSKMHKREIVEPVTILEAPPMVVIGVVGLTATGQGLRVYKTAWAQHISTEAKRRFVKNWYNSKKKAFVMHSVNFSEAALDQQLADIAKNCSVVRVLANTQTHLIKNKIGQKKAHIMEIQVNGGDMSAKVAYAKSLLEQPVKISQVFGENELIDCIGATKGKGFEGVITRFGVHRLPRKTHRGFRRVACIGAWHPSRVSTTVPRPGQHGYHHRVEMHKKIYRIGKAAAEDKATGKTEFDLTEKSINPMGGFPHYGFVDQEFLMVKGSTLGSTRRVITLRKTMHEQKSRMAREQVALKFIDTSSKYGHGRFQTSDEKVKFLGPRKKDAAAEAPAATA